MKPPVVLVTQASTAATLKLEASKTESGGSSGSDEEESSYSSYSDEEDEDEEGGLFCHSLK
jgi:hypothetical protein